MLLKSLRYWVKRNQLYIIFYYHSALFHDKEVFFLLLKVTHLSGLPTIPVRSAYILRDSKNREYNLFLTCFSE